MTTPAGETRRRYDSALRRERAAQTRERIVAAGAELIHGASIRDWQTLTIRAVADRAGVNERTVYRHFANERALRDAVMHRLEEKAGVDLAQMQLDDVAGAAERILRLVSAYPTGTRRPALDPTLSEAMQRQHDALLRAVGDAAAWPGADRTTAAAALDVLWSVGSYERLVVDWGFDREQAIDTLQWVIGLVGDAVREGRRPGADD